MNSKGFWEIPSKVTGKIEAGNNPLHTTEALIGYTVCWSYVN